MTAQVKAELHFEYNTTVVILKAHSHHSVPPGGRGKPPPSILSMSGASVLRQGPYRELALHGQAGPLIQLLCPLSHQLQTKLNPQSWHLQLGQSLLLELHGTVGL
ncbi:hypothetical protein PBY51_023599 [Eleginops maclovinus]|uniref:Uncharacterized protein n=1 Tax=Eleginops maclovinus TaxID=56733 RepID=A0AAN7X3B1_ELEMC|nr:hypothetical protein PBY51_023599 [Eleginops maclovinus]